MKPQSKITVFMVVMIVMLSIYYFTLGGDTTKETGNQNPSNTEVFRYEEYEQLRAQISESREVTMTMLQTNITSADVSLDDKNLAINAMMDMNDMSTNEYSLETSLRNMGYLDVLVTCNNSSGVVVRVLDTEHSAAEVNSIIVMAKSQFGSLYDVSVQFDTDADDNY